MVKQKQIQPIEPIVGIPRAIVTTQTSHFTKIMKEMYDKRYWHLGDTLLLTRGKLKDFTGVEIGVMTKHVKYIDNLKNGDIDLLVIKLSHVDSEINDVFTWEYWWYQ